MKRLEDSPLIDIPLDQEDADNLYKIYTEIPRNYYDGCPTCFKNEGIGVDGTIELDGVKWQCNCADQLQRFKHYLNSGIGRTYQSLDWKDFFGDDKARQYAFTYVEELGKNLLEGKGCVMYGQAGVGKTMLAALVLKAAIKTGVNCYMTTAVDFIENSRKGWNDKDYRKWFDNRIGAAKILVIDDLGKELEGFSSKGNDAKKEMQNLVRVRTQRMKPTLITTNLNGREAIEKAYGDKMTSLLDESSDFICVTGDDARAKVKETKKQGRIY